jgi:hypothetical protein
VPQVTSPDLCFSIPQTAIKENIYLTSMKEPSMICSTNYPKFTLSNVEETPDFNALHNFFTKRVALSGG